jgi:hypothetical protein
LINRWALGIFAPLLLLVGVLGFVSPGGRTSGAPAYNVFHLAFGALGLALVVWAGPSSVRLFNVGFGLLDLYQALASRQHWFPEALFRWKPADDVLHVVFGIALVAIGALG